MADRSVDGATPRIPAGPTRLTSGPTLVVAVPGSNFSAAWQWAIVPAPYKCRSTRLPLPGLPGQGLCLRVLMPETAPGVDHPPGDRVGGDMTAGAHCIAVGPGDGCGRAKVAFTTGDRVGDATRNFNVDGFGSLYPKHRGAARRSPPWAAAGRLRRSPSPAELDLPFHLESVERAVGMAPATDPCPNRPRRMRANFRGIERQPSRSSPV